MSMCKKVLISGASRGLGLALVEQYLQAEWVVYAGVRDRSAASLMELKVRFPALLSVISLDVSNTASVHLAAQELQTATDALDVIINNAAIHRQSLPTDLVNIDFEETLTTYNTNTLGALRVTQAFLPCLLKSATKVLVNISSEAGSVGLCKRQAEFGYCMSKAALNIQSMIEQNYLAAQHVKVLAIHPGWMRTDMGGSYAPVDPFDAAAGIYRLVETYQGQLEAPIYMDYTGRALAW